MGRYKSWEQVRREADLNEDQVAAFGRIADAETRFYEARHRRGVSDAMMARALGVDEDEAWSVDVDDPGLFLAELGRHVAAAGGRLELRAVFDDEEVLLLREPPAADPGSAAVGGD